MHVDSQIMEALKLAATEVATIDTVITARGAPLPPNSDVRAEIGFLGEENVPVSGERYGDVILQRVQKWGIELTLAPRKIPFERMADEIIAPLERAIAASPLLENVADTWFLAERTPHYYQDNSFQSAQTQLIWEIHVTTSAMEPGVSIS